MKVHVVLNFLANLGAALFGIFITPFVLRRWGPEAYGLLATGLLMQTLFGLLEIGFSYGMVKMLAEADSKNDRQYSARVVFSSVEKCYLIISLAMVVVFYFVFDSKLGVRIFEGAARISGGLTTLQLFGPMIAGQTLVMLYRNALFGLGAQGVAAGSLFGTTLLRLLGAWFVFENPQGGIDRYCLVLVGSLGLEAFLMWLLLRQTWLGDRLKLPFRWRNIKVVLGFSLGLSMVAVSQAMLTQLDRLLLTQLLPLREFGYFSLALTIANGLVLFYSPISNAAYPVLVRIFSIGGIGQEFLRSIHHFSRWISVLTTGVFLFVFVFADQLVQVWLSPDFDYHPLTFVIRFMMVGIYFNALAQIPLFAQFCQGITRFAIGCNIFLMGLVIPLTLWAVPEYGLVAVGWIWGLSNACLLVYHVWLINKRFLPNFWRDWLMKDVAQPLVSGAIAAFLLSGVSVMSFDPWWERILGLAGCAFLIQLAVLVGSPLTLDWVKFWFKPRRSA